MHTNRHSPQSEGGAFVGLDWDLGRNPAKQALKGLKGRPAIKPSGLDTGTEPVKPANTETPRRRGQVTPRVSIEERVVTAAAVPAGSRFKGHEPFLVQDLVSSASATC